MTHRTRRMASICLVGAVVFALLGQYYFAARKQYMWDGVALYVVACALFLAALRLVSARKAVAEAATGPGLFARLVQPVRSHPWRTAGVALGLALTAAIGTKAQTKLTAAQGYELLVVWGAVMAIYVVALADLKAAWAWLRRAVQRVLASPWELMAVLALLAVALATRLVNLETMPFVLGGDEGSMGQEALHILAGKLTNPFTTGWFSHPTLFFYLQALSIRIWGATITALRFMPAVAGALAVPALYLLARELFGRRVALVAAAFLACYDYAIHYARLGLNNIVDPVLAVLAFYFMLVAWRKRNAALAAVSGLFFGLGQYFYMGSRAIPIVLVCFLGWCLWREPGFWRRNRGLLFAMAGGFVVAAWPLLLFFLHHPNDFMARMAQIGIFQSGWLPKASALFKRTQADLLVEQFLKSALAFHYYADPTVFYHPGRPLLDVLAVVPFTFGAIYSMWRWKDRRYVLLVIWFWVIVIFGGMLLENPPASQRILLTIIPVAVFVALGLDLLLNTAERAFTWKRSSTLIIAFLATVTLCVSSTQFYFGPYSRMRVYAGPNTEAAHNMGLYLRSLGSGYRMYFFGAPRMYSGFPNMPYLAPDVPQEDVLQPLTGAPTFVKPDSKPVFVFLPERAGELEQVKITYPSGKLREFRQPNNGAVLFIAYEPD